MTNSIVFKRVVAYCIDLLIISVLITLLSQVNFLNPNRSKYKKAVNEYTKYNEKLQEEIKKNGDIDTEKLVNKEYVKIIRNIDYYGASYTIIEIVVFLCYFTILPFFHNGQTFGKEFMKIKIVNKDDSKAGFLKLLVRALLIPIYASVLLYTSLKSVILVVFVFFLKPWPYFYLNGTLSMIMALYCYADVFICIVRKNSLALHDLILRTKVVEYVRTK